MSRASGGDRGLPAAVAVLVPDLTRRQLEYWTDSGWVLPDPDTGRGRPRSFSPGERQILVLMYRLVTAGFPARTAAFIARQAVTRTARHPELKQVAVRLADGIWVSIDAAGL